MSSRFPRSAFAGLIAVCLAGLSTANANADPGHWYLQSSVATRHFSNNAQYNNRQNLIGLERNRADRVIFGAATFRNSFSQRSHYAYMGKRFDADNWPVYAKLSGGLVHGYRGKYRDKLPLNRFGVAPAIIPAVGANLGPVGVEWVLLGAAATMVNVGVKF